MNNRIKDNRGGVGGVIRNQAGNFIGCFAYRIHHVASAQQVELLAIRAGLELVQPLQLERVVVESDCLLAVQAINSNSPDLSSLGSTVDDILVLLGSDLSIAVSHASRSSNLVAHSQIGLLVLLLNLMYTLSGSLMLKTSYRMPSYMIVIN